ncbi:hypothetical protein [Dyadobacter aurulentus]|uniref:hypothetical protein n=1 Tax=Dyadobacter sp. UC 10 TaxID=2605428 RepID=UPI0011F314BF|nr:hypothetical protein [Dyadobacter sp. UC 10]KAA0990065.1 hypothetical protein FXO21_07785 [Dyadobacter sp. UC 10]
MLDQLFELIQKNGKEAIIENQAVPNEHNDAVMQVAQSAIVDGLSNLFKQGQISALSDVVKGAPAESNPAVQQISDNFMGNIMERFGINGASASSIASAVIPVVINQMLSKTQSEGSNGLDLGSILANFASGNPATGNAGISSNDLMSMLGKFGLDKDGDGTVGLNDLSKLL